ncbi:DNA (cytosine-5)-methyltransferase 1 [Paucimonas lemoignei]|uniref:DNA (cytosine-5-)-methyltransferase n=1 Tax=Paucimonas lemoignei TaxID=29443 RepID=A0A4R3HXB0_PAULE|nr:DNA cytosine methyltransferase [Paucimonas lemoignei]TCS37454.1 DNA (cytosine-5)-methyltransferase 1 [Paucimonas lemoignei]
MKRDIFTMALPLGHELAIDNFAGGGGASTGIAMGLGREVDVAINHDGEALAMHAANHPTAAHYTEDVFAVHPGFVTRQLPIGLAWFSPDCKHFSKAKGSKPVEKKIRGLAWVTLKWATFQMPRVIALENVEEFQDWGPLGEDNKPLKSEKGRTFKAFVLALTTGIPKDHPDLQEIYDVLGHDFPIERLHAGLGYQVEWRVLRACDYGTPTIRKRLFLIARRDGRPIVWPAPTHGDPKSDAVKSGKLLPWHTAAECIDWSIPCPSIFERKRPLKDATLRRIAKGIMKFVVNSADPFIVGAGGPVYSGKPAASDKPFGTLTAENHRAVVVPTLAPVMTEHANASSPRCMPADEPLRTICAQVKGGHHALITAHISSYYSDKRPGDVRGGPLNDPLATQPTENRHALVSAFLAKHYSGVTGIRADVPAGTVTSSDHHSLVTSHLVKLRNNQFGQEVAQPAPTLTAGGGHIGEVRAFLIKYYTEGGQDQSLADPMHTIPTKDRLGLVTIKGEDYAIVDIGMRMLTPRELARAQGFPDSYILDPVVNGKPLSKSAQVRMIGNSVCPPMAKALVEANFTHEHHIARAA